MFRVLEWNRQKGLYLDKDKGASKGSTVMVLNGEFSANQTQTSIKVDDKLHVEDNLGRYINHSCYPTVKISGLKVIAVDDLKPGSEITFNYQDNEDFPLSVPFECRCCGEQIA